MTSRVPAHTGDLRLDPDAVVPATLAPGVPAAQLLRAALDASPEAVVLCTSADHTILLVNAAAAALVPGLAPGGTAGRAPLGGLAGAIAEGAETFVDEYGGRRLLGHRRRLDDRHYAWYLRDCTEEVERPQR
jgi:PAS domain-containing protein